MGHRIVPLLAVLAVLVAATGCQPRYEPDPDPTGGLTRLTPTWTADLPDEVGSRVAAAPVLDGFVVVREDAQTGLVGVVDGATGTWRWTTPAQTEDPVVKVRATRDAVVVLRDSDTIEVHDPRIGEVRLTRRDIAAVGIGWGMLLVSDERCAPDCLLRALDPRDGRERWTGPRPQGAES